MERKLKKGRKYVNKIINESNERGTIMRIVGLYLKTIQEISK